MAVRLTTPKNIYDKLVAGVGVTGTFWQATQPVSGTFWQATQPVSAVNLDIRDLTSASDSVTSYPKRGTAFGYAQFTITTSATQIAWVDTTKLAVIVVNNSTQTVYLGDASVTTSDGLPLAPGASYSNDVYTGTMYARVAAGTADVRVHEYYEL